MRYKPFSASNTRQGFTLIEVLISLVIASMLGAVIIMSFSLINRLYEETSTKIPALANVQNVGFWVSQDAMMAQSVSGTDTLTLRWSGSSRTDNQVIFKLQYNFHCG
jgi:prepilin-type N-terminal cleavage/methylation domain-containing protein